MATDYSKEIARLEALVNGATSSVSTDGLSTTFDLEKAKARLAELQRLNGASRSTAKRKINSANLGGCW